LTAVGLRGEHRREARKIRRRSDRVSRHLSFASRRNWRRGKARRDESSTEREKEEAHRTASSRCHLALAYLQKRCSCSCMLHEYLLSQKLVVSCPREKVTPKRGQDPHSTGSFSLLSGTGLRRRFPSPVYSSINWAGAILTFLTSNLLPSFFRFCILTV